MNEDKLNIEGLDRAALIHPVRLTLGRPGAEIVDWQTRPIAYQHPNPISGGLYRLTGTAQDGGETLPWSLVLKITQPMPEAVVSAGVKQLSLSAVEVATMLDAFRWEREANAYRSGLLDTLVDGPRPPPGLRATASEGRFLSRTLIPVRACSRPRRCFAQAKRSDERTPPPAAPTILLNGRNRATRPPPAPSRASRPR